MASVTFTYTKQSGSTSNTITMSGNGQSFTFGPNTGSRTVNLVSGATYSLTASSGGPGGAALQNVTNSSTIGLDDRQGITDPWVSQGTRCPYYNPPGQGPPPANWVTEYPAGSNTNSYFWDNQLIATINGSPLISGNTRYDRGSYVFRDKPGAAFRNYYCITKYVAQETADFDYQDLVLTASGGFFTGSTYYAPYDPPTITFYADPNPQNSTNGVPQNTVQLLWTTTNTSPPPGGWGSSTVTINQGVGSVSASGSTNVNTGLQSQAGTSNSPATKTYRLTATNPNHTVTSDLIIQVRNDNTPSTSWITSFSNLNPNTTYEYSLGQLQGVDMATVVSTSGSGNFVGTGVGGTFATSRIFYNNESIFLRFTTLPFNTDLSGVSDTSLYGKTNSKTIPVTIGSFSFNVTITTRAPRISEEFNYLDNVSQYPFEDIDFVSNTPTEYLTSATVTADDIEIPVEIKSSNPDMEVNINNTGWKNVRSI